MRPGAERMTRRDAAFVALVYLAWLAAAYAINLIASGARTPQALFESWVRFDGIYFRAIAEYGYAEASQRIRPDIGFPFLAAFFPVFPLAIRLVAPLFGGNYSVASVIVPQALTLLALWALFDVLAYDFSRRVARLAVLALVTFPTFYFLTTAYSETAFLLLVILAFRFYRARRMVLAGVLGALAAAARIMGAPFLIGTFALDLAAGIWQALGRRRKAPIPTFPRSQTPRTGEGAKASTFPRPQAPRTGGGASSLIPLVLAPLGLVVYAAYLGVQFGDPLLFMQGHASLEWQVGFDPLGPLKGVLLPFATVAKHAWMAPEFRANMLNALFLYFGAGVAAYAWRRVPFAYSAYAALALILPMFTGSLISMPRYVLVSFPLFAGMGIWLEAHPRWRWLLAPLGFAGLAATWLYFHTVFLG